MAFSLYLSRVAEAWLDYRTDEQAALVYDWLFRLAASGEWPGEPVRGYEPRARVARVGNTNVSALYVVYEARNEISVLRFDEL